MKHAGIARRAALKLILLTLLVVLAVHVAAVHLLPNTVEVVLTDAFSGLWVLFTIFTLYFFRDPTPKVPPAPGLVVSPAHGKVDCIDQLEDGPFVGGPCHRISIFLSVIDIHIQNAPIGGTVKCVTHTPGMFVSALRSDSAEHNENVLVGFDSTELIGEKIGLRLIAGVLARRIVPFVKIGDDLKRGERMSLIQFGSRCDLYIPARYTLQIKLGDRVVGGETVMATR